jgi:hypothetical protein
MKIHPSVVTNSMVHLDKRRLKADPSRRRKTLRQRALVRLVVDVAGGVVGFGSGTNVAL